MNKLSEKGSAILQNYKENYSNRKKRGQAYSEMLSSLTNARLDQVENKTIMQNAVSFSKSQDSLLNRVFNLFR